MSNLTGRLFVVATPIGNLQDITLRAIETLRSVDRIAAEDTRHSRKLLQHYAIEKPMIALHDHNEDVLAARLVEQLQQGQSIALVSDAGTPLISDPGFPLVRACRESGVEVIPVPGASALIAALSVAGLPTDHFRFEGFMPRKQQARRAFLEGLLHETATLVFYESSHRIQAAMLDMVEVFGVDRQATLARELTKVYETVISASLAELRDQLAGDENQRKGEFVVMLAGAQPQDEPGDRELDRMLGLLLEELPLKQAAALAARITGLKRNAVYQRALFINQGDGL